MNNAFAARLRQLREERGWSQSYLAEKAKVHHSYVSRMENGAQTPSRGVVLRLSQALSLEEVVRDELLMLAGHLPEGIEQVRPDADLVRAYVLLHGDELTPAFKEFLRHSIQAAVRSAYKRLE